MSKSGRKVDKQMQWWNKLTTQQKRVLGVLYQSWNVGKIYLYPLLCIPQVQEFHTCTKLMRGLFGGNRSSKSTTGAADFVMFAMQLDFYRHKDSFPQPPFLMWIVTEDFATARDVALKKILFWLPPDWIKRLTWGHTVHEIELVNGVVMQFRSWSQGYERQKGREVAYIWFDEEPYDENVFREVEFRTIGSNWMPGEITITCTPDKGYTYVIDRVYNNDKNDPEVAKFTLSGYDNPYINRRAVARMHEFALAGDNAEIEMRIYGRPAIRTGAVYPQWNPTLFHEKDNKTGCLVQPFQPKSWWDFGISIDPGADCFAACWFFVDENRDVYLYKAIEWRDTPFSIIAKEILNESEGINFRWAVIDGAEKAAMQELANWGINCVSHRAFLGNLEEGDAKGGKRAGIERVKYYLTGAIGPRLWVFNVGCEPAIKQMDQYVNDAKGEPRKDSDHFPDAIRYFLGTFPPSAKLPTAVDFNDVSAAELRLMGDIEDDDIDNSFAALSDYTDIFGNKMSEKYTGPF
jgi:phage terminase large subunit-like protein